MQKNRAPAVEQGPRLHGKISSCHILPTDSEAEFLDEIQTKVLRVFLLAIRSHLYLYSLHFALRFIFLQNSRNLLQSLWCVSVYCTVKEKEGNHTPFPMVSEIHTETSSLKTLQIMPGNLKEIVRS